MSDYPTVSKPFLFGEDANGVPQWSTRLHFTDLGYKTGTIEDPTNWQFVYIPAMETREQPADSTEIDYWRIPQSLHREAGMNIAAGYRKWQAGYQHNSVIAVRKGERYLCRAAFRASIGGTQNPSAVEWMWFVDGEKPANSQWASYDGAGEFGSPTEHLFLFTATEDGVVRLTFWGRSLWRDNTCDLLVSELEVLHVERTYGDENVGTVKPFPTTQPLPDPTPIPIPTPNPTPVPAASNALTWILGIGLALAIVLVLFVVLRSNTAASAQDVGAPVSLEQAAELILAAIVAIVMGAATVPVVEPLTNFVKWVTFKLGLSISADHILLGVSTVVTIAVWLAGRVGLGLQLDSLFALLVTVLPILTQLLTSLFGSKALYAAAVSAQVAGFGYQRTA